MSDLSRLLEDVYRSGPAAPAAPAAPSWSSDTALEEAFADWVPGPSDDAPAAERAFAGTETERDEAIDQLDSLMQQAEAVAADVVEDEPVVKTAFQTAFENESPMEAPDQATIEFHEPVIDYHEPVFEPAPELATVVVPTAAWSRQDDDILPARGHGRRRRISLKRR